MTPEPRQWVAVGRVGRAKGLRGEMRVELYNPGSDIFFRVDEVRVGTSPDSAAPYAIDEASQQGNRMIVRLNRVESRDQVDGLKHHEIIVPRTELPPPAAGEYYCVDLIGLSVVTSAGEKVGTLREIWPTASNDVYAVDGPDGEILLPATKDVLVKVDLDGGRIVVNLPKVTNAL